MSLSSRKKTRIRVEIFTKEDCHLCDKAKSVLIGAQGKFPIDITEIDITTDKKTFEEFKEQIPVVFIEGRKAFKFKVDESELIKKLERHR